jgi:Family of unknown function (DUF6308)
VTDQRLTLAGETFDLEKAKQVVAGYCFHETDSQPHPPHGDSYGNPLVNWKRRRWGYLSYDCQRGPGPAPDIVDVMAPVMLNVSQGYGVRLVSDLLAITPHVREVVEGIPADFNFWDLEPGHVVPKGMPEKRSASDALHRAWYLVESAPGVDVAITHKFLHHAWPHLFPLIDNRTLSSLGEGAWVTILEDLQRHAAEFDALEAWFKELAKSRDEVALTRLRLYDILLWCRVVGEDQEAAETGKVVLTS